MKITSRKEAREQGLARYFTGKPCKRGHVVQRVTANGTCDDCAKVSWNKNRDKRLAATREWNRKNAEHVKNYRKEYYERNKEHMLARSNLWKRENPEKHAAINRKWAADNPDSVRITKQKRKENDPDSFYELSRERSKRFYQRHPDRVRAETAKHRAARLQRMPPWADKEALKFFYECCPAGCHVDHIVPLQGEFISGLHVETNLQWLPDVENIRKGNKYDVGDEFVWLEKI